MSDSVLGLEPSDWPLLDAVRDVLGSDLDPETVAFAVTDPNELYELLCRAYLATCRGGWAEVPPSPLVRPYENLHPGTLTRVAVGELGSGRAFGWYTDGLVAKLVAHAQIVAADPVAAVISRGPAGTYAEGLEPEFAHDVIRDLAPGLLIAMAELAPLVDAGLVVIAQYRSELGDRLGDALDRAVREGARTKGKAPIEHRPMRQAAEALAANLRYNGTVTIEVAAALHDVIARVLLPVASELGLHLPRHVLRSREVHFSVPMPEHVSAAAVINLRGSGRFDEWYAAVCQANAIARDAREVGSTDEQAWAAFTASLEQERLRLLDDVEQLRDTYGLGPALRTTGIGLGAGLFVLAWGFDAALQAFGGDGGVAGLHELLRSGLSSGDGALIAALRHYDTYLV